MKAPGTFPPVETEHDAWRQNRTYSNSKFCLAFIVLGIIVFYVQIKQHHFQILWTFVLYIPFQCLKKLEIWQQQAPFVCKSLWSPHWRLGVGYHLSYTPIYSVIQRYRVFNPCWKMEKVDLKLPLAITMYYSFSGELPITFHSRIFPDWPANQPIHHCPLLCPFEEDFHLMLCECFSFQQLFFPSLSHSSSLRKMIIWGLIRFLGLH